jgi:hypothetical protein
MKPGAGLLDVVSDVEALTRNFSYRDSVVVLAGTNDVTGNKPYQLVIYKALQLLEKIKEKCNVAITTIPRRFNNSRDNENVIVANSIMKQRIAKINRTSNKSRLHLIELYHNFKRNNYTSRGLHLNSNGKWIAANILVEFISKCKSGRQISKLMKDRSNGPNGELDKVAPPYERGKTIGVAAVCPGSLRVSSTSLARSGERSLTSSNIQEDELLNFERRGSVLSFKSRTNKSHINHDTICRTQENTICVRSDLKHLFDNLNAKETTKILNWL